MLIAVLIACATAPVNMTVDFLFGSIIAAPLEEEYTRNIRSRQNLGRRPSQVATTARRAVRNSFTNAKKSIFPVSSISDNFSGSHNRNRSLTKRLSSSFMKHFTVADASTRRFPPETVLANAATTMVLKDVFLHQNHDPSSLRSSQCFHTDTERGGRNTTSASLDELFTSGYTEQYTLLNDSAKKEFQDRWGVVPVANNEHHELVPCGLPLKRRRAVAKNDKPVGRRLELSTAMDEASTISKTMIAKLRTAPDNHVGMEIMHMFIIDLLG